MKRHAKASSAGSIRAAGSGRAPFRSKRPLAVLAALALALTALAATAASALAAPNLEAKTEAVSNVSYASAHLTGHVSTPGPLNTFFQNEVRFQYSTDKVNWTTGSTKYFGLSAEERFVEGDMPGLKGGTTYYARIAIAAYPNEAVSSAPYLTFTTLDVEPPTIVAMDDASEVFSQSAKVTGKIKRAANPDPAFDITACRFEYITDAQFDENESNSLPGYQGALSKECDGFLPITAAGEEKNVATHIRELTPSATYHVRLAAEDAAPNSGTKEAAHTFTTSPPPPKPTVVSIEEAKVSEPFNAKLEGVVERPAGGDPSANVSCRFEFITDAKFKENESNSLPGFEGASREPCRGENPIEPAGQTTATAELNGNIAPSTTYHLRLTAENLGGTDTKVAPTFTTLPPEKPTVTIDPVTSGTYTTAHVSGTVEGNPAYLLFYGEIEESTDNVHWQPTFVNAEGPCCGPLHVEYNYTGLQPGTTYYFRISASYYHGFGNQEIEERGEMGRSPEPNPSITTEPLPAPTIKFDPVSDVTINSAHFTGSIETHAPPGPLSQFAKDAYRTEWHFECKPECPATPALSGVVEGEEGTHAISVEATRLETNTFYEKVKLVANNAVYTVETPGQTFQTPLVAPVVKATPGGSAGKGSYNVGGIVTPFNSKISDCHFEYGPTTEYVYSAPCSPNPVGRNEVQTMIVGGNGGFWKIEFRGQTTENIPAGATAAEVEHELQALSAIGPTGVSEVKLIPNCFFCTEYEIYFGGTLGGTNLLPLNGISGSPELEIINGSPPGPPGEAITNIDGGNNAPVLVEAHLTGLTPGATYHYRVVATNSVDTVTSGDNTFVSPLSAGESTCPNEATRVENNSTRLPECRAYELVTSAPKAGFGASLYENNQSESLVYQSNAGNIEGSGQGVLVGNYYVAQRTDTGWETLANLNGPRGSFFAPPQEIEGAYLGQYSTDLRRSVWMAFKKGVALAYYLREPNGEFKLINDPPPGGEGGVLGGLYAGASPDLSHVYWYGLGYAFFPEGWPGAGRGIYEFEGLGNHGTPRRIDVHDSGEPISECNSGAFYEGPTQFDTASIDGKTVFFTMKACEGHPAELWARVNASKTFFLGESQCTRTAADPGGACNGLSEDVYWGPSSVTPDGAHIAFTTKQQLVNSDTNESSDLYLVDMPSDSNSSPTLVDVSGSGGPNGQAGQVLHISDDGSTIYFVAQGVLASNHDALDEPAHDGDNNVYVWHRDQSHPDGQTSFIGRLTPGTGISSQITGGEGRYMAFRSTASFLPTDTDNSADMYRYDDATGEVARVSVDAAGTGGNADNSDVEDFAGEGGPSNVGVANITPGDAHGSMSDDGEEIVFTTSEGLDAEDGNGAPDVYIWKNGRTALISTGSVGGGANRAFIDGSGKNIYFGSGQELTQNDTDSVSDVYDARIDGGFGVAKNESCNGEACQPPNSGSQSTSAPATDKPNGPPGGAGNYSRATVSMVALTPSQRRTLAAGGKIELGVRVSGPGTVTVKGVVVIDKKQSEVIAGTARAVQPGLVKLPVSLSGSGLSRLRNKGALKVQLSAVVADSEPATSTVRLKAADARRKRSKQGNG